MKRIIILSLIAIFLTSALLARVTYLNEEEYNKLKKKERLQYWENLETELADLQQRKSDAINQNQQYEKEIEDLKQELEALDTNYDDTYQEILTLLNMEDYDKDSIQRKLNYFNNQADNMNSYNDDQLWEAKKTVNELIQEYNDYKSTNVAKIPEFVQDFSDLDRKIKNLDANVKAAKPKYYEDNYTVKRGDYLSKISGYSFIYNDPTKWGIIYRANRDQISDPNVVNPNQVLKIPRGLPYTWKVYRGEYLWKIASYPEIYNNGAKWPLIYRANRDKIKDPDLIYPNQVLQIPRD